jgi:hypothetical protein
MHELNRRLLQQISKYCVPCLNSLILNHIYISIVGIAYDEYRHFNIFSFSMISVGCFPNPVEFYQNT